MGAIVSENVAQAITKMVAAEALDVLIGNTVMGNLVNRDYEPDLASHGDEINVPLPPVMQTQNLAEGDDVQTQNPNLGNAKITLNQHKVVAFQIPDVTKAIARPDLLRTYFKSAVVAIAEDMEKDLLALVPNLTANAPVGSANTALTEAVVESARKALTDAKVPQKGRFMIGSSKAVSELNQIARFSEVDTTGNPAPIVEGRMGRIKGMDVYETIYNQFDVASSTNWNFAGSRDAFGLVVRRLGGVLPGTGAVVEYAEMGGYALRAVMSYTHGKLAQMISVDVLYGCGILRNVCGVAVKN